MTPTGKIKRAAPHIVANWVSAAWKRIDVLWNDTKDDGERGNESTSSGLNSDDSEYDE